ncbi:MAG: hypothetical protein V1745_01250 [Patescibacteria group bacterium]
MTVWPIIISFLVLGVAYLLYRMLPEITEAGSGILWAAALFLVGYSIVAFVMSRSMPAWGTAMPSGAVQDGFTATEIKDVIVK